MANVSKKFLEPIAKLRRQIYAAPPAEIVPGVKTAYEQIKPFERVFVDAYVATDNPIKASQAVYPNLAANPSIANVRAMDMLSRPLIQAAIAERYKRLSDRFEITAENVTREIALMAFARMGDYVRITDEGEPFVDMSELTSEQMAAISEVTVEDFTEGRGPDARQIRKVKFKLHDKGGALDKLAKIVGVYAPERLELTGANGGPIQSVSVTMSAEQAALAYQQSLEEDG